MSVLVMIEIKKGQIRNQVSFKSFHIDDVDELEKKYEARILDFIRKDFSVMPDAQIIERIKKNEC